MSIENINTDLEAATRHLQKDQEAAHAAEEIAHGIWETVGSLATGPSALYLFDPSRLSRSRGGVTPRDITTMVDTAATGYSEARAELSSVMKGSGNDHLNNAHAHLNRAVELLREDTTDATTQAKMMEANVEKLGEGVEKIVGLLFEMSGIARSLKLNTQLNGHHAGLSIGAIEAYQQTL